MEFKLLYWYWLVIGPVLMLADVFIARLFWFWFGLAAIVISVIVWFEPQLAALWQLLAWIIVSAILLAVASLFQQTGKRQQTALHQELVGETGRVVRVPQDLERGIVRFNTPLLGSEEWPFFCEDAVRSGDQVAVREVAGNMLIVDRCPEQQAESS